MNECCREMYTGELLKELADKFPEIEKDSNYQTLIKAFDNNQITDENHKLALSQSPNSMIYLLGELNQTYEKNKILKCLVKINKKSLIEFINEI